MEFESKEVAEKNFYFLKDAKVWGQKIFIALRKKGKDLNMRALDSKYYLTHLLCHYPILTKGHRQTVQTQASDQGLHCVLTGFSIKIYVI